MYDIFDDLFEDAYESSYEYDDVILNSDLAFEAAMAIPDYDPAYEGFGDMVDKAKSGLRNIGNKISYKLKSLLKKIAETFKKAYRWITERFAGVRTAMLKKKSNILADVLKELDNSVKNAGSAESKKNAKIKADKVKRAIMAAIDGKRKTISLLNNVLADVYVIVKGLTELNKRYIGALKTAIESKSSEDGTDLKEKHEALFEKFENVEERFSKAIEDLQEYRDSFKDDTSAYSAKITKIVGEVVKDKIDATQLTKAIDTLEKMCVDGTNEAAKLGAKISDYYISSAATYKKNTQFDAKTNNSESPVEFEEAKYSQVSATKRADDLEKYSDQLFDDPGNGETDQRLNAGRLVEAWRDFSGRVAKLTAVDFSKIINAIGNNGKLADIVDKNNNVEKDYKRDAKYDTRKKALTFT